MNKGIIGVIFFTAGGAAGFLAANKLMQDKYEQLVQDEIDSVKAAFRKEHPQPEEKPQKPTERSGLLTASIPRSWAIPKKKSLHRFRLRA